MALQSDGSISIADVAVEFGGDAPHGLNEYYDVATGLPVSGIIGLAHFYGTTAIPLGPITGTWAYDTVIHNPNAYDVHYQDTFGAGYGQSFTDGTHWIQVAVGEDRAGGGNEENSGQAYIFDVATGNLVHTLANPNLKGTVTGDGTGSSCAIHGSHAIWGQPYDAVGFDDRYSGSAYIYDVTTGNLLHSIANPNPNGNKMGEHFGHRVALNDTHAAITSPYGEDSTGADGGLVYIYNLSTGALERTIENPNVDGGTRTDNFGGAVAMNSTHVLTAASNAAAYNGIVYLHKISDGSLTHSFANPNTAYGFMGGNTEYDGFGGAIDLTETHCVMGAVSDTNASNLPNKGSIYIYDLASPANPLYSIPNPNLTGSTVQDSFGHAVAINGAYVVATSPNDRPNPLQSTVYTGAVFVFELSTGSLVQTFSDPDPRLQGYSAGFALQISMSDQQLLVTSHAAGGDTGNTSGYSDPLYYAGKVYSYTLTPN